MRKQLKLAISEDRKIYGVDILGKAVLFPEDFRSTVVDIINEGKFKDGDAFQIDVDENDLPVRRQVDHTVAVHRPFERFFSKKQMLDVIKTAIKITKEGNEVDANLLVESVK